MDDIGTRAEHIAWVRQRALEELEQMGIADAYSSLASDLQKHSGTKGHPAILLGWALLERNQLNTPEKMRKFIEEKVV